MVNRAREVDPHETFVSPDDGKQKYQILAVLKDSSLYAKLPGKENRRRWMYCAPESCDSVLLLPANHDKIENSEPSEEGFGVVGSVLVIFGGT